SELFVVVVTGLS
ncbi:hypothetical protein A2U01_0094922, partial [Trifolium medium]|nr:hypothetical protein [Trifolium medium]